MLIMQFRALWTTCLMKGFFEPYQHLLIIALGIFSYSLLRTGSYLYFTQALRTSLLLLRAVLCAFSTFSVFAISGVANFVFIRIRCRYPFKFLVFADTLTAISAILLLALWKQRSLLLVSASVWLEKGNC